MNKSTVQNKYDIKIDLHFLSTMVIALLSVFAGYLDTSIPAFVFLLFYLLFTAPNNKYSIVEIAALGFASIYILILLIFSIDIISTLKNIKWFFGIVVFLLLIKNVNFLSSIESFFKSPYFFISITIIIIIETILINFIFHPIQIYGSEYISSTIGPYNRPLGPMGNASMTATFLIAYFAYFSHALQKFNLTFTFLFIFTVLLLMTSTGFLLLLFYYIITVAVIIFKLKIKLAYVYVGLIVLTIYALTFFTFDLQKISFNYYILVVLEKFNFLSSLEISKDGRSFFSGNNFELLFGHTVNSMVPLNGGDFAWLNLLYTHGTIGFIIFIFLILAFYNRSKSKSFLPITILFLGGLHYGVIFNSAGQLLLAFLIIYTRANITNKYNLN